MTTTTIVDSGPQVRLPVPARYAMAACGVLAPVLFIVAIPLNPIGAGDEGADAVAGLAANIDAYLLPSWIYVIGTVLWFPASLRVGRVARANAPALGLTGLVLAPVAVPVAWFSGSTVALMAAWAVLVVGFAGCALAFLSQPAQAGTGGAR